MIMSSTCLFVSPEEGTSVLHFIKKIVILSNFSTFLYHIHYPSFPELILLRSLSPSPLLTLTVKLPSQLLEPLANISHPLNLVFSVFSFLKTLNTTVII